MECPATLRPIPSVQPQIVRRTANFHPDIWGNRFIDYSCDDDEGAHVQNESKAQELKEKVRADLAATTCSLSEQLIFIDSIQRLGVAYHFSSEIEEALNRINAMNHDDGDLHIISLRFRLLRQQRYNVSCDIFKKFKDEKGGFEEHLADDVQGLLSLYEAAHMRVHGEDILDEALAFTITHLECIASDIKNPLTTQITHVLKWPLHKSIPRVDARRYISIYQDEPSHNKNLLMFAKLDFNMVQLLHRKELRDLSLWWKDLDVATKLPFARDRLVEGYFWILIVYFEPQYLLARKIMTKVITMSSIIDDIYDAYGTLDELKLFTDAIHRWDVNCIVELPDYMKTCYQALLDVFKEIEYEMAKDGNLYRVHYAKLAIKNIVIAYFEEAKWCDNNYIPRVEEYMQVALVTCGYNMLTTISLLGMGEIASKKVFDWVLSDPKIVRASSTICRLTDDMVGHEFEQERGHVASAIECYVKQNGVLEQAAHEQFKKEVQNAWKTINEEYLRDLRMPKPILERVLNLTRAINVLYAEQDEYTHVGKTIKDGVTSLLIDPVPV